MNNKHFSEPNGAPPPKRRKTWVEHVNHFFELDRGWMINSIPSWVVAAGILAVGLTTYLGMTSQPSIRDADSEDTSQIPAAQALASRTTTQSSKAVRSAPGEIREKFTPSSASFPPARLTQKAVDDRSSTS